MTDAAPDPERTAGPDTVADQADAPDLIEDDRPGPPPNPEPTYDNSSLFFGGLLSLLGHLLPVLAMYVAAQSAPVGRDGFGDLANALTALLIGEIVLALLVVVGAIVFTVKGRKRFAAGLVIGWVLGAVAGYVLFKMN